MQHLRLSFEDHHIFSILGLIQAKGDIGVVLHVAYLLARGLTEDQDVPPIPEKKDIDKMWTTVWPHGAKPENKILAQALVNMHVFWFSKIEHRNIPPQ